MNIDGGGQAVLADLPGVTQAPRFAADGESVIFDWFNGDTRKVAKVPLFGGPVEELVTLDNIPIYNAYYWALSPDGKSVAHSIWVPEEQKMKIAVRPIDVEVPSVVLDIWPSLFFKWSPDGKSIIYREAQAGNQPQNVILSVDIASGRSRTLYSAGNDQIVDLAYSRDQKNVAVVRGRNSSNAVLLTAVEKPQ